MEGSSESGMDMGSSSDDEGLRKDINALAQLDDNSDIAFKITLEQNNMIVNKTPTSNTNQSDKNLSKLNPDHIKISNVDLDDTNMSNLSLAYINLSNVNPENISMSNRSSAKINMSNANPDNINMSDISPANINLINVNPFNINMSNVRPAKINLINVNPENVSPTDKNMSISPVYTNMSNVSLANMNIGSVKEANTNISKVNTDPSSLNVDDYPFERPISHSTSYSRQQSETAVIDLSTDTSLTSHNKDNLMPTSYFQPFNYLNYNLNQPSTSKHSQDTKNLNCEENPNVLDNLSALTKESSNQAIAKAKTIVMETNELEISLVDSPVQDINDDNLLKPTKPTDENQNSNLSDSGNKIKLFAEDTGPHWHNVQNNIVTDPVITANLPKIFADFPIFGKPENGEDREHFQDRMVRKFVGCDLDDAEYAELKDYCSVDNLKTGKELFLSSKIPTVGPISEPLTEAQEKAKGKEDIEEPNLYVLRKLKMRMEHDPHNAYSKKLKYRGCRIVPMNAEEEQSKIPMTEPSDLDPGKDILYKVRVYRPFIFMQPKIRARMRGRHSVFSSDLYMVGRQPLWTLRDRFVCRNDTDMRLDVSNRPDARAHTTCKDMFPSGFLFINNVFYVDRRAGCRDTSATIRQWAKERGIGDFPVRDMAMKLQDIAVRLAHPEVYVHQGNCEHVFLFSEIRLLSLNDPLHLSLYPYHTSVSQNHTIKCTPCSEYGAKWIVTGTDKALFDPAFFCDTCFKLYMYKDGKKLGDFKAYAYKGNELRMSQAKP